MHEHTHDHGHHEGDSQHRLALALFITLSFMGVEVAGGILFNSLALLADAGHMLSDVTALGLSWLAFRIGRRAPGERHTYGYRRSEILAALCNGLLLWAVVAVILYEAGHRFYAPLTVKPGGMLAVASLGLAVNVIMAALLFKGKDANLNVRAAFLHVIADALGSSGAILAAVVIMLTGMNWVDPLVSVLISALILYSSWGLLKESAHILMEGVPRGLDVREIEDSIVKQAGVCCVHDLHVWSITSNRHSLSAHVVLADNGADRDDVLDRVNKVLRERFSIDHTTIQIQTTHEIQQDAEGLICRKGTTCNISN